MTRQGRQIILQPPHGHGEGRDAEIGLGLATTSREPEEIGECLDRLRPVSVCRIGERRDRQQQEYQLERAPRSVLRHVQRAHIDSLVPSALQSVNATDTLHRHGPIGEAECLQRLRISEERAHAL